MPAARDSAALRRCVLAVSVVHDLDVIATDDGVELGGHPAVLVDWPTCAAAAGTDPEDAAARTRLATWLAARRFVADHPAAELAERARPVALPRGHVEHPGPGWPCVTVAGGVLDLGVGIRGLMSPDRVDPTPAGVLAHAGYDDRRWWPEARTYLERMGRLAADRFARDPDQALRPMGDCDALTLLAAAELRRALVADAPGGMRQVAVPMRSRGWLDLRRTDVGFARAAAALTAPAERGLDRPALVTAHEVALPPDHGDPAGVALRDPPAPDPWWQAVSPWGGASLSLDG